MPALNPWFLLGSLIGALLLFAAGAGIGIHYDSLKWKAAIAHQNAEASSLLTQLTDTVAKKDQAASEFTRNLDQAKAHEDETITAAHAEFDRLLADRVRDATSRQSRPSPGAAQAPDPGKRETVVPAGIVVSFETATALGNLAAEADKLTATMRACQVWAREVGR